MQQRKGSFHVLLISKYKSTPCTARNSPEICSGWLEGIVGSGPSGSRKQGQRADLLPGSSPGARTDARACRAKGLLTTVLVVIKSEIKVLAAAEQGEPAGSDPPVSPSPCRRQGTAILRLHFYPCDVSVTSEGDVQKHSDIRVGG